MTKALLIPTQGQPKAIEIPSDEGHKVIRESVGGWFDCVHISDDVVMYVHDEGLLIGLEPNVIATLAYGRPIAGDVVLVGSLNAKGEYDGENHDLAQTWFTDDYLAKIEAINNNETAKQEISFTISTMDMTPQILPIPDDYFDRE